MTTATTIPNDIAITLVDPKSYADHTIHDSYKWLRANNPLGRAEVEGYDPFWVVTSVADGPPGLAFVPLVAPIAPEPMRLRAGPAPWRRVGGAAKRPVRTAVRLA